MLRFFQIQVSFTSKGVRIAGTIEDKDEKFVLHIYKREVIKVIAHFASSEQAQPLLTLYMLKTCAQYVKAQLQLPDDPPNERKHLNVTTLVHKYHLNLLFSLIHQ